MLTMFLSADKILQYKHVSDLDINALFQEASKVFDILIREKDGLYKVYFLLNNAGECQVYNFYSNGFFCEEVNKSIIMSFLLGILITKDRYENI